MDFTQKLVEWRSDSDDNRVKKESIITRIVRIGQQKSDLLHFSSKHRIVIIRIKINKVIYND